MDAVQNQKRCAHLVDVIEGVEPTLESIDRDSIIRQKQVSKLKEVIEEAQKLIQKQSKRSSFNTQMCFKEDFDWVEKRVFQHMDMIQFNRYTPVSVDTSSPRRAQKLNAVAPDAPGPEGDMQILGKWCEQCIDLQGAFGFFDVDSKTEEGRKRLGVVLDDKGRVAVLEWNEKKLASLSPTSADLGRLNALWGLNLQNNELTELPEGISQVTSLTDLFLPGNKLADLPGKIIGRLTSLTDLYLGGNYLRSVPAEIGRLRELGCKLSLDDGVTIEGSNFTTYASSGSGSGDSDTEYSDSDTDPDTDSSF